MSNLKLFFAASCLLALLGCNRATPPTSQETSPPVSTNTPQFESPVVATSPIGSNTPQTGNASPEVATASPEAEKSSPRQSPTAATPKLAAPTATQLISANGIGPAKVGMTLGELKKALAGKAQFQVNSPFIVDFDAIAVVQGGKEQFYILYPAGVPLADSDIIEALITNNPNYRTAQGVGAGTPIQQAETVYGDATLSYNLANESREYVKFTQQPAENISFRVGAANDGSVGGIYPEAKGELNETKNFQKNASIRFVEVYCNQNCPLPAP